MSCNDFVLMFEFLRGGILTIIHWFFFWTSFFIFVALFTTMFQQIYSDTLNKCIAQNNFPLENIYAFHGQIHINVINHVALPQTRNVSFDHSTHVFLVKPKQNIWQ